MLSSRTILPFFVNDLSSINVHLTKLRLKPEWCKHPSFNERLTQLSDCVRWELLSLDEQSILLKEIQRDAALYARDRIFTDDPTNHNTILTRLSSIARCVWNRDLHFYDILIRHAELARTHLIIKDGAPSLISRVLFEEQIRKAKLSNYDLQKTEVIADGRGKLGKRNLNENQFTAGRRQAKLDALERLSTLWAKSSPKVVIIGSRLDDAQAAESNISTTNLPTDSDGLCLVGGNAHTKALTTYWGHVFAKCHSPPSEDELAHLMDSYDTTKWDWSKRLNFDMFLMERYVDSLKHTGTGKDGIHNFCLKFGCRNTLLFGMRLMDAHMNCKNLPADINDGLFVFASATYKEDDHLLSGEGIFRCPVDLRPLPLKNADHTIV